MLGKELLSYVDHTLLRPTATWDDIKEICEAGVAYKTASVCIPPDFVASAHEAYPGLNVCTVIGFPLGYETTEVKVAETKQALSEGASEIDMVINLGNVKQGDFGAVTDEIKNNVASNQELLEEYIRFKGALIELGKVGNAFTAELSNNELAFKENGQKIAYISNQSLVITNAEIRNKLSLGNDSRGWFDFIPRTNGNLSIKWRGPAS